MPPANNGRPPFRADHIGSLLRPAALRAAFRQHASGNMNDSAFRAAQDAAIRDILGLQEDCGLEVVTDGEFRRISYWERFVRLTRGLVVKEAVFRFHDAHGHESDFTAPYAAAKVGRSGPIALDEFAFLKRNTSLTGKVTMPAPSTMHFYRFTDWGAKSAYTDPRAFFADLGKVYQGEIADLHEAGCRYVQLDEVALAMLCDPALQAKVRAAGGDPDGLVDLYVDAINEAVAGAPADMAVGLHLCRGNYKGMYLSDGGYTSIAERLFHRANVSHFLLEFDTPRAGDFAPLALAPKTKGVVLGLVSSKTPALESLDLLKKRTAEASRYIDLSQLAISPQCGFASTMGGNPVTEADERAKLRLCVDVANLIWR
ncbi:MAG: 5-methyltetrahydropteroyltriglutamate--homocysteine S-methyltransferase [Burkholderiales bacterium]|nr:5-methyltetrahydropteroyltriglutamate--homocysteine S-methyltransferase [Burkholderiales bacterium]